MDFNDLFVFAKVVQSGSFTAAARVLQMPKSSVSRRISDLETRIGAQLLQRTTRMLRLTEAGKAYYPYCARIVAEAEAAEEAITNMQAAPQGLLRVTAPLTLTFLGSLIAQFLKCYPKVQIELLCTDRTLDLLEDGFDLALRIGRLTDSSLVARKLGYVENILVAAPSYLEERGAPNKPEDLEKHDCLCLGRARSSTVWSLHSSRGMIEIDLRGRLVVNDPAMLRAVTLSGAGIALLPNPQYAADVAAGRLHRILPEWHAQRGAVHVLYPGTRHPNPKVLAFVDFLRERWPGT